MTNIKSIINNHRLQMEAAGLMRRSAPVKLSPQTAALRPSLTKVQEALRERPDRFAVVQPSPFSTLFEYTLPKLEVMLVELGEEKAEEIIGQLCEHGKEMIEKYGAERAKEHLESLFNDLPDYEAKIKEENGVSEIIDAYRSLDFEGRGEDYLKLMLGDKIYKLKIDEAGMILLRMKRSTNDSDLVCLRKFKNMQVLDLKFTRVIKVSPLAGLRNLRKLDLYDTEASDVSPLAGLTNLRILILGKTRVSDISSLAGLTNLQELNLGGTRVSDVSPLAGLRNLQKLFLWGTHVSDVSPLAGLRNLEKLGLSGTQVSDISPLAGLRNLLALNLGGTQVSDTGVERLKESIPGVEIIR